GIAMEELVEQYIIAEVRVLLLDRRLAEDGPLSIFAAKEDAAQPAGKLGSDFAEMQHRSRSYRTFDLEVVAVVAVKPPQRFDDQRVYGHPERAAAVRVAAKHTRGRLSRDIVDAQPSARMLEDIRMFSVQLRQGAN